MKKILFAIVCATLLFMTGCVSLASRPAGSGSFAVAATNANQTNIVAYKNVEADWMRCDVVEFVANYTSGDFDNVIDVSMTVRQKGFGGFLFSTKCKFAGVAVKYGLDDRREKSKSSSKKSSKKKAKKNVDEEVDEYEEE